MLAPIEAASTPTPAGRVDARTGVVRARFGLQVAVAGATPEEQAADFLRTNGAEIGVAPDLSDVEVFATREGIGIHTVRYRQTYRGVPVDGADIAVTIDDRSRAAIAVTSEFQPDVTVPDVTPTLAEDAAEQTALLHLGASSATPRGRTTHDLVVWSRSGTHRLAWRIRTRLASPRGSWEVFVDAHTGEVVEAVDRADYANGSGLLFHPDPITSTGATYGDPGYVDNNDANSPELTNARVRIPLDGLTPTLFGYVLTGPYVTIQDAGAPDGDPAGDNPLACAQADSNGFSFTRDEPCFESAMVYSHITQFQLWLQTLGFTSIHARPVTADPHGLFDPLNGGDVDNSRYDAIADDLAFGEGTVDDAEDAGVIIHEYGHALQHDQIPDWAKFYEAKALNEACSDYLAASYCAAVSTRNADWLFHWDGPSGAPGLVGQRRMDYPGKVYPDSMRYESPGGWYLDGRIWTDCLWQIHGVLGRIVTDRLVMEANFFLSPGATFRDAAMAVIEADKVIGGGANEGYLRGVFSAHGILPPKTFVVDAGPLNQMAPAVAYDRFWPSDIWGRSLITVWSDFRANPAGQGYGRRMFPSGGFRTGDVQLPGGTMAELDVASASRQNRNPPRFFVVGSQFLAGNSNIVGCLVRADSLQDAEPVPFANTEQDEDQPAVDGWDNGGFDRYLVAYRSQAVGGLQMERFFDYGAPDGGPIQLFFPPDAMSTPAVCGGTDANDVGEFLVAWEQIVTVGTVRSHIRAARVAVTGAVLDPAGIDIAMAPLPPPGVAGEFNQQPAIAWDGTNFLVVWRWRPVPPGVEQLLGRFVDPTTGKAGAMFQIDPGPVLYAPDVAFARRQYCVTFMRPPIGMQEIDVYARRFTPDFAMADPMSFPVAATTLREENPSICAVGGDRVGYQGQSFYAAWDQGPFGLQTFDIAGTFIDEMYVAAPPLYPQTLGVEVLAIPPDTTMAPGDTVLAFARVANTGTIVDSYRLTLVQTASPPWTLVPTADFVTLDPGTSTLVPFFVIAPDSFESTNDTTTVLPIAVSIADPAVSGTGTFVVNGTSPVAVGDPRASRAITLSAAVPNPSRQTVAFTLATPSMVNDARLVVYDARGRRVRTLIDGALPAGVRTVMWDGDDDRGARVAAGIYACRLEAAGVSVTRRVVRLR